MCERRLDLRVAQRREFHARRGANGNRLEAAFGIPVLLQMQGGHRLDSSAAIGVEGSLETERNINRLLSHADMLPITDRSSADS